VSDILLATKIGILPLYGNLINQPRLVKGKTELIGIYKLISDNGVFKIELVKPLFLLPLNYTIINN
jgi:hypothetical protein